MAGVEAAGRAVLSINPDNADGLILMGRLALARNDHDEALRLALCALSQAPTDLEALSLLAATKMKKSLLGGLWWRWNQLLIRLGEARAIFLVVGIWVIYRWAMLASRDAGLPEGTGMILTILYLGFVVYTISANVIVTRMVQKEIRRVPARSALLDELDLLDLVIAVARRRRHLDLVADLAADQRPAERRIVADPPVLGVGLGLADQLVSDLLLVLVEQGDGRAEHDLVRPTAWSGRSPSPGSSRSSRSAMVASTWP